ncbi:glycosyltransferase [Riemerella anatipestifer]|nr:glycosyltransferase [Riemerella anatipestifer]
MAKGIEDKIRLLYAGSPGRKDDLYTIIKVYLENVDKLPNLEFNIVGIGEDFLSSQNLELGLGNIRFYGRLPFERVRLMYKNSHFSFLIRENKRYANAGFSTKFVESMSLSTPVIANLTSDIEKYLKNDINGVVINKLSEECILEVLIKINNMSLEQYENIQYEAYKTSQLFRGENFINNVKDILL